jgi:hypothetical protein
MALDVIGAGFGRTGTLSLKAALEQLGLGPCYHQYELIGHPEHALSWSAANAGDADALRVPLHDYRSTVDWPGCTFWRELCDLFPAAKVVLSVRPPDRWYASFRDTVGAVLALNRTRDVPPVFAPVIEMNDEVVRLRCFGPDYDVDDKTRVVASYEAHNAAVRSGVAPDRLLEFDVAEGWEGLCRFLDVPEPASDFPNINDREQFRELFGLDRDQVDPGAPRSVDAVQQRFRDAMNPTELQNDQGRYDAP